MPIGLLKLIKQHATLCQVLEMVTRELVVLQDLCQAQEVDPGDLQRWRDRVVHGIKTMMNEE